MTCPRCSGLMVPEFERSDISINKYIPLIRLFYCLNCGCRRDRTILENRQFQAVFSTCTR